MRVFNKFTDAFGSIRFWYVLIGAVVWYLGQQGVLDQTLVNAILGFLGVGTVVRTADRFRPNP